MKPKQFELEQLRATLMANPNANISGSKTNLQSSESNTTLGTNVTNVSDDASHASDTNRQTNAYLRQQKVSLSELTLVKGLNLICSTSPSYS